MASLSAAGLSLIETKIDSYTTKENGIPGLVFIAVNRNGERLVNHASGLRGLGSVESMTTDSTFWMASCTKLVTSIAAMQLVEAKKLSLDDADIVETIAPELKKIQVLELTLDGSLHLVEKRGRITLRMLLTHTAGFGYSFLNPKLKKWSEPIGLAEYSCLNYDIFTQPLVNHPGERWEYGVNLDWVGLLVERVTRMSLGDYFRKFIFDPLGIQNIGFFPTTAMKEKLVYLHDRLSDGKVDIRQDGHLYRRPLVAQGKEDMKDIVNSGGAGLFSNPEDFCEIIATLINDGFHHKTGNRILRSGTVDDAMLYSDEGCHLEMFSNQIPQFPDFGRALPISSPKPYLTHAEAELYPQPHQQPQGWGLSFFYLVHSSPTGRSAGSGFWSGLANLIWWVDRTQGVGGLIASQMLPFGDHDVWKCESEVEHILYQNLSH
ncbi:beta-lactamase/transpeptidase-like protein [Talaromyces proteolyticus]|uniref:Beta-lactamase/transpeptidase-like protein n=1 Tax=Talaromyces proteolyticus TaxID=1131652 RepID=A0AAD4KME5_9EURO|nr:beta-lactamase/transpeptidase-like protein [Talaromyces proteolyticus]KAH8694311.1 beta-lactamase/transpeptidase-like protein [Talaromyces proteolyticus]